MKVLSLDIETRSTARNAAIVSIGAVAYDFEKGEILGRVYSEIDQADALKYGVVDASTEKWWAAQNEETRKALQGKESVSVALDKLAGLVVEAQIAARKNEEDFFVISRAPQFDCAILRRHFDLLGKKCPWAYWQERDHRTFETAWQMVAKQFGKTFPPYLSWVGDVVHIALDDASAQLSYLFDLYQHIKTNVGQ